ncbi:alpha/beta fold hydrolase BchO [Aquisediminimonas profunda]|uniref:alpha/beta fold hydrolase BchO n=1 Tax=Aquisediminimonas profunda TaxID=1550733 RepID=UPI001C6284A6|nr:alpha/beta fold hydrolase BchO [Aquisediminimonas profunda]
MSRPSWDREGRDWPNRAASRFVDAAGVRWHVQVAGTGPALLLLHGTGAATHSWRDLFPLLTPYFTVVAPDLPGHGFSVAQGSRGLTLVRSASNVAALLDTLAISPAVIVGHSAGAAIAVRMAIDGLVQPERIHALNGALLPFPGIAAKLFPAMAQMLFVNPLVPRLFALQARISGEVGRFLARSTGSQIDAAGAEFYARLLRTSGHCAAALGMMANWDLDSLARDLPDLRVPLTLIHGEKDAAIPIKVSRDVSAIVTGAQLVALPGLGHLAHEESPQRVADIIGRTS